MDTITGRRTTLRTLGLAFAATTAGLAAGRADAAPSPPLTQDGAGVLN